MDIAKGICMWASNVVSLKIDALVECMTNFAALFKDKLSYSFTYEKCTV